MKTTIPVLFVLIMFASPAEAAQWPQQQTADPHGIWHMSGDRSLPCEIIPKGGGRALFINEKGWRAWGRIQGDRISVPDWGDQRRGGLEGRIRRNTILWSNGTYWTR